MGQNDNANNRQKIQAVMQKTQGSENLNDPSNENRPDKCQADLINFEKRAA